MDKRVGIIMCTWKRPERLDNTLNSLCNQTYKDFNFYIWNNNISIIPKVDELVVKYGNKLNIYKIPNFLFI